MRFGVYELDLRAGELRKQGVKVRLQEQPLQILTLLLERPGEIVTREEIRSRLWPEGTFVDFDHSLNAAVMRLRESLDDSADNPRFIETVPRRGYRFIALLEGQATAIRLPRRRLPRAVAPGVAVLLLLVLPVALNVGGLRDRLFPSAGPTTQIDSIAVLPLNNLSGDPEQEYFADGMTDAFIIHLQKIRALRVISRTSVMGYKRTEKPLPQIARELKVDGIIEGTVLLSGNRVRVAVQLFHGSTERNLWGETYERDIGDVLVLQSEVSQSVAHEIQIAVTPTEAKVLAASERIQPEAYGAYLKGRYFWNQWTREGIEKSVLYFHEAIRHAPNYAPAYAGLADAYVMLGSNRHLPAEEAFSKGRTAAQKALELDDRLADAHAALANILFIYDWDWAAAEREFRRALELNPGYAPARQRFGFYLASMGRPEESRAEMQKAKELDPLSISVRSQTAWCLFLSRNFDAVIQESQRILDLDPDYAGAHTMRGLVYVEKRMFAEAQAEFDWLSEPGRHYYSAYVSAALGRRQEARRLIDRIAAGSRTRDLFEPSDIAVLYAKLGDGTEALRWLRRTYEEQEPGVATLKVDPRFDPLRGEPEFQNLLRRLRLRD